MNLLNGTWEGVFWYGKFFHIIDFNFLLQNGNGGTIKGAGVDSLAGNFDIEGTFSFDSDQSHFNLSFEKKYFRHDIMFERDGKLKDMTKFNCSTTIPLSNTTQMSGKGSFDIEANKWMAELSTWVEEDGLSMTKFPGS